MPCSHYVLNYFAFNNKTENIIVNNSWQNLGQKGFRLLPSIFRRYVIATIKNIKSCLFTPFFLGGGGWGGRGLGGIYFFSVFWFI